MQSSIEEKLRLTVVQLLEKDSERPSISALCSKAGISRASFYLYYKDMNDFVRSLKEYIIEKLYLQLVMIIDMGMGLGGIEQKIVFDENDIKMLCLVTGKHVYWDFATQANGIIQPRFEQLMIQRFGREGFEKNREAFEFMFTGAVFNLYVDLINFDKDTYISDLYRMAELAKVLFNN